MTDLFDAERALFFFNLGLLAISLGSEICLVLKDKKQKSRFFWFGVVRICLLIFASGLVVYVNVHDLIPDYNPMRLVLTAVLLHITLRDVYDLVAR